MRVPERGKKVRTDTFSLFVDFNSLPTRVHLLCALLGESGAVIWDPGRASTYVHSALERVTLPSEDVVRVLTESSPIFHEVYEFRE